MFNSGDRIKVIKGVLAGEEGTINLKTLNWIFYLTDSGIQRVAGPTCIVIKPKQHKSKPHPLTKIFQNETTI